MAGLALLCRLNLDKVQSDTRWFLSVHLPVSCPYPHPRPAPPPALRAQIAALAQQCLDAAASHPAKLPALEARLNALVYQAYGLDDEDVQVIEGSVGGKGAED